MDFKIDWSPTAKFDFKDLIDFISEDKPQAAVDFRDKILSHINQLKVFPKAGRKVPEFNDELIREIIERVIGVGPKMTIVFIDVSPSK